jgi:ApbE superfamily uncharacterized protein (UPF0280 family)
MLNANIANRIKTDADWAEVNKHIHENVDSLDSLDGINFLNKEEAAIEGRARALAREKLQAILEPFFGGEESKVDNKERLSKKTGVS